MVVVYSKAAERVPNSWEKKGKNRFPPRRLGREGSGSSVEVRLLGRPGRPVLVNVRGLLRSQVEVVPARHTPYTGFMFSWGIILIAPISDLFSWVTQYIY